LNLPQKLDLNSNDWKAVQFTAIFIGSVYILFYTSIEKTLTCLTKRGIKNERILRQGEGHKMGKYNFDEVIDRHGTDCLKYDFGMKRKGRDDLLPLWVADMDFRLPDEILDEFHKRIDHGIFGYTDPLDEYFAAMNHWFSTRYGYTIEPEWVTLGAGIVYALGTSVRAFTEEGDAMMVMQPVYYPFSEVIKNDGRRLVNCQLRYENNHYSIDFEKMEKMIREEGVKALIFCNPHNPVGRVWTREELERVAQVCLKYNVIWMVDEMHCDFIFPGHTFTSCMNLDEKYRQILALYSSPGKTFNVAGLQPANIIIPNEELRKKYQWANTQAAYSQGSLMGQLAVKVCYTKGAEWVDELVQYIYENVKYMSKFVKENFPKAKMVEPEGTYLVWVDFSGYGLSNEELEHLMLEEAKLWLDSGIIFGPETAQFERFNVACPRATVKQALTQLKDALDKHLAAK